MRAALAGRDCLVVMPTGAGKSLTFQLPAAITAGRDDCDFAVDCVDARPDYRATRAHIVYRGRRVLSQLVAIAGRATRRFKSGARESREIALHHAGTIAFGRVFGTLLQSIKIARLVVDEAHCISRMGPRFSARLSGD